MKLFSRMAAQTVCGCDILCIGWIEFNLRGGCAVFEMLRSNRL